MSYQDEISLSRQTIVRILSATTFFLLVANVAGQVTKYGFGHDRAFGLIELFNVDREGNIPSFFSSSLLLLSSLLLALITALKRKCHDTRWPQWAILSFALLFMAVDEAAGLHERLNDPGKALLGHGPRGFFYMAWVIFGIPFVLVFALSYLKFFFRLPPQTQRQFFAAASIFLSGALGMELIGGNYAASHGMQNFQYSMLSTVEEGLEMGGVIILINALLNYVLNNYALRFSIRHFRESSQVMPPANRLGESSQLQNSFQSR